MSIKDKIKIRVYHSYYGCESGCCGHVVELSTGENEFKFIHPYGEGDIENWAQELAKNVIQENWPKCLDSIDWGSLVIDVIDD